MIPILLLISLCGVGVLGVVAMGLGLKDQIVRSQRDRVRHVARLNAEVIARESARVALKPTPTRNAAVAPAPAPAPVVAMRSHAPLPVGDLTGVINTLEESTRFRTVPTDEVPVPPRRAAKGSVAPPMTHAPMAPQAPARAHVQPAPMHLAAPVQPPVRPQMYPVVHHAAKPPPIPGARRLPPPVPPARRR